MAEWYVYAMGIFAAGLGLVIVYIILNKMKIVGSIPIFSNIVDPLVTSSKTRNTTYDGEVVWYDRPRGKNGFWNPNANPKKVQEAIDGQDVDLLPTRGKLLDAVPERFGEDAQITDSLHDRTYHPKNGTITETVGVSFHAKDGPDAAKATLVHDLKNEKVYFKDVETDPAKW